MKKAESYNISDLSFTSGSAVKNLPTMQENQVRSLGQEDPLEEGMAIHFSILTRRTLWIEKPGRLKFMGSQSNTTE